MVALNRIYTRSGDDGTTSLVTGERRAKSDLRVESYGTVDETNAQVGAARLYVGDDPLVDAMLARIQNDLFDLGADLSTPEAGLKPGREALRIIDAQTDRLEAEIDLLNAELSPLRSFVLPGGSPAAAHLHIARTVARRAERAAVALAESGAQVSGPALRYLNRLSDLLFVAARAANDGGRAEVFWKSGATR